MKLGILNAIHPEQGRIDWGGTPVDAYIRFIKKTGISFEYEGYNVALDEFPESPAACDAYLITGSPKGTYDEDAWIGRLSQFIRDAYAADKKLVGICFGHQILAEALGGHSEKSEKGRGFGPKQFDIYKRKAWMPENTPDSCTLYFAHQDQVMELPPGAELLAGNGFCNNIVYSIDGRVLAMQAHPEITQPIMEDILELVKENMTDEVAAETAVAIQNDLPDADIAGQWIVNFLLESEPHLAV